MHSDTYIISGGQPGSDRLTVLADATWATTRTFLRDAGVGPGARILALGCGNGEIDRRCAIELMAGEGEIVAIDRDEMAIRTAGQRLEGVINARTIKADIVKDDLTVSGVFDFVHLRFLLSHLQEPGALLEQVKAYLRPGGRVLIEDVDFDGHVCYPDNPAFNRYVSLYKGFGESLKVDPAIGRRLYLLVQGAGYRPGLLEGNCPAFYNGPGKQMALITMQLIAPGLVASGFAEQSLVESTIAELEAFTADPGAMMTLPHIFQIAGER